MPDMNDLAGPMANKRRMGAGPQARRDEEEDVWDTAALLEDNWKVEMRGRPWTDVFSDLLAFTSNCLTRA